MAGIAAVVLAVVLSLIALTPSAWAEGHWMFGEYHFFAKGYWYSSTNINYQTLGVSGRITVYDNKIKGTGIRIHECVNIAFSDGSWIQIGYMKNYYGNMELKYYYEYFFYPYAKYPGIIDFEDAILGEVPEFKIYLLGFSNDKPVWRFIKDGEEVVLLTAPSADYASGCAEAFFESVDVVEKVSYNEGIGFFTTLKYYDGSTWAYWDAIKCDADSPYHVKPLNSNRFKTWGDYDADP